MNRLPRAKQSKLGWTIDPEVLISVGHEVQLDGWDACMEVVEVAMLAAERMILENNSDLKEISDARSWRSQIADEVRATSMMRPKLMPCPFCGSEAEYKRDHTVEGAHSVWCTGMDCDAHLSEFSVDGDVRDRWNARYNVKEGPDATN